MTGIREMFSELSGSDDDWFQLAFLFESRARELSRRAEDKRKRDPKRMAYKSKWVTAYVKRRMAEDPKWAEERRAKRRVLDRKRRERLRASGGRTLHVERGGEG